MTQNDLQQRKDSQTGLLPWKLNKEKPSFNNPICNHWKQLRLRNISSLLCRSGSTVLLHSEKIPGLSLGGRRMFSCVCSKVLWAAVWGKLVTLSVCDGLTASPGASWVKPQTRLLNVERGWCFLQSELDPLSLSLQLYHPEREVVKHNVSVINDNIII